MKVSLNWLKQYAEINQSAEEIASILTDTGLEVEGLEKIEAVTGGLAGVVIGKVISCEQHPDADRLKVTKVDIGEPEPLQIVCGAPNVAAGQTVVVATVGTTLYPDPNSAFKIKKSKIRGVVSEGMICAEDEIGLGESHDGIMVLASEIEPGTAAADYFDLKDDVLIEIGLTPNRCDAMGHIGVARDLLAAINVHQNKDLKLNWPSVMELNPSANSLPIEIEVLAQEDAPRYCGLTIRNVKVAPSPEWLQQSLRTIGLSPINNVVDITNYVMHELGTPLHAFDYSKTNGKIAVKKAIEGEEFVTLDGEKHKLSSQDLMITNGENSLCIAGVYGGLASGVSENTNSIFLEAAYFNPVSIRKTAKKLGLHTDASFRFERGVDVNLVPFALKRAASLIVELCNGELASELIDCYPTPIEKVKVSFSTTRCKSLIGKEIDTNVISKILQQLDINISKISDENWELDIPQYRADVTREADVIEEILRIYGFNNVEIPQKMNSSLPEKMTNHAEKSYQKVADMLANLGFSEIMNNSLTSAKYVQELGGNVLSENNNVNILNPLSNELSVMRQSLLFQTLESISYNQNRQNSDLKLFEFGKTYHKTINGYEEKQSLIIAISGQWYKENWNTSNKTSDFFDIKGISHAVFAQLGLSKSIREEAISGSILADGVSLNLLKEKVGEIGYLSQKMLKYFGIKQPVFVAIIDWDMVINNLHLNKVSFEKLPKTFAVRRDFSLLLDEHIQFAEITQLAKKCDKKLLQNVKLFDVYEGKQLPDGKKSYAVSFYFQDKEETLKDEQIDRIMEKIEKTLVGELNCTLR
jgi:phenylalanyl-tRNA synthetase beta chain